MTWVAVAIIGSAVVSGGAAAYGSRQSGRAAQRGADAASAESARQFDLIREDTAPLRSTQGSALDTLARLYGWAPPTQAAALSREQAPMVVGDAELPSGTTTKHVGNGWYEVHYGGERRGTLRPGGANGRFINDTGWDINAAFQQQRQAAGAPGAPGTAGAPNMGAFFESPDYQFNLGEGQKAIDRSLAARGRTLSGAGVKEGVRYASGMASGEYGRFVDRLLAAAGLGTTGVSLSANAGMAHAGNVGAAQMNAANTRASGYMDAAAGVNNAVQGGVSNLMLYRYLNQPQRPVG